MSVVDAKYLVEKFNLLPHPEGGFYGETFRSDLEINSDRIASTAIYFLITPGNVSRFHRIKSDEVWHFYLGGPMSVVEISPDSEGMYKETILGQDIINGEIQQLVVKRDTWFGCFPAEGTSFSFVGCTVAPGFDFRDFELASRASLLKEFPKASEIIVKLTEGLP
jgi:predicted cupin superfamily sugar epimerase